MFGGDRSNGLFDIRLFITSATSTDNRSVPNPFTPTACRLGVRQIDKEEIYRIAKQSLRSFTDFFRGTYDLPSPNQFKITDEVDGHTLQFPSTGDAYS